VTETGTPDGSVYDWYHRGLQLLAERNPEAAATLLARAADAEPESRSITRLISVNPTDDYAHFGLGLAASRAGELRLAAEHLALAAAMRPDLHHYAQALRGVRARRAADPT
jgi:tetratricopeptide (TPR) repeat protein